MPCIPLFINCTVGDTDTIVPADIHDTLTQFSTPPVNNFFGGANDPILIGGASGPNSISYQCLQPGSAIFSVIMSDGSECTAIIAVSNGCADYITTVQNGTAFTVTPGQVQTGATSFATTGPIVVAENTPANVSTVTAQTPTQLTLQATALGTEVYTVVMEDGNQCEFVVNVAAAGGDCSGYSVTVAPGATFTVLPSDVQSGATAFTSPASAIVVSENIPADVSTVTNATSAGLTLQAGNTPGTEQYTVVMANGEQCTFTVTVEGQSGGTCLNPTLNVQAGSSISISPAQLVSGATVYGSATPVVTENDPGNAFVVTGETSTSVTVQGTAAGSGSLTLDMGSGLVCEVTINVTATGSGDCTPCSGIGAFTPDPISAGCGQSVNVSFSVTPPDTAVPQSYNLTAPIGNFSFVSAQQVGGAINYVWSYTAPSSGVAQTVPVTLQWSPSGQQNGCPDCQNVATVNFTGCTGAALLCPTGPINATPGEFIPASALANGGSGGFAISGASVAPFTITGTGVTVAAGTGAGAYTLQYTVTDSSNATVQCTLTVNVSTDACSTTVAGVSVVPANPNPGDTVTITPGANDCNCPGYTVRILPIGTAPQPIQQSATTWTATIPTSAPNGTQYQWQSQCCPPGA